MGASTAHILQLELAVGCMRSDRVPEMSVVPGFLPV